ncbi:MAG: uroporphyrinogen-III synthase [Hyphomicrobiaceae bacterium]
MRILVTRAEPDASQQAEELLARGHQPIISPMLSVTLLDPELDAGGNPAALAVTSRNALKALELYPPPEALKTKPLFCVGPGTAQMARELGFAAVIAGDRNAAGLAGLIRKKLPVDGRPLIRLTGDTPSNAPQNLEQDLERAGYPVKSVSCYRITQADELTAEVKSAITEGVLDIVILMSPLTARTFQTCIRSAGLTIQSEKLRYVCLSQDIAGTLAGIPRKCIFIADKPNHASLLSILDHAVAELS